MKRLLSLLLLGALCGIATPATAQPPKAFQQTKQPGDVEVDPIKCFWKTDRNTIVVGERFTVILTCGIIDTDRVKAVPDFNQLEASTIGLQPFERRQYRIEHVTIGQRIARLRAVVEFYLQ